MCSKIVGVFQTKRLRSDSRPLFVERIGLTKIKIIIINQHFVNIFYTCGTLCGTLCGI